MQKLETMTDRQLLAFYRILLMSLACLQSQDDKALTKRQLAIVKNMMKIRGIVER